MGRSRRAGGGGGAPRLSRRTGSRPRGESTEATELTLPDPLTFADGSPVASAEEWPRRRREIVELFEREIYGRAPAAMGITWEVLAEHEILSGLGTRRQVRIHLIGDANGPKLDILLYVPSGQRRAGPGVPRTQLPGQSLRRGGLHGPDLGAVAPGSPAPPRLGGVAPRPRNCAASAKGDGRSPRSSREATPSQPPTTATSIPTGTTDSRTGSIRTSTSLDSALRGVTSGAPSPPGPGA